MAVKARFLSTILFVIIFIPVTIAPARSSGVSAQYRATMTQIFLWQYHAFPIFVLNPIFPGDVVQVNNETIAVDHKRCYANMRGGNYKRIAPFLTGLKSSISIGASIKGELLDEKLAEIDASGNAKSDKSMTITVDPLSLDKAPDAAALRDIVGGKECQLILDVLDGKTGGYMVTYGVLHGVRNFVVSAKFTGNLSAGAKGDLLELIQKAFSVKEADIKVSRDSASFAVSESPAPMTLAIIPAALSAEDVIWVTSYLEGNRSAELKIAVDEAIQAEEYGIFQRAAERITFFFDGGLERAREIWARRFVNGGRMLNADALNSVDFEKIAYFGAAMELVDRDRRR
jgi:hypothetical protein